MEEAKAVERMIVTLTAADQIKVKKACDDVIRCAKGMHLRVQGPMTLPPKITNIWTRLNSPPGGPLYGNFQSRVYRRDVRIFTSPDVIGQIISDCNIGGFVKIKVGMFNPSGEWETLPLASFKAVSPSTDIEKASTDRKHNQWNKDYNNSPIDKVNETERKL